MKRKIVLVVSVAAGLLAALLTKFYLSGKDEEILRLRERFERTHRTMTALCYGKNVPGGTRLTRAELGTKTVPESGLRGQALTEADLPDVLDRKIVSGHRKGEVLFWSDLEGGNPNSGGLAADIKKTMRAVSINASGAAAVSGMVRPNDHVDVIGTFSFPADGAKDSRQTELVTCTILQNVLVLATGKETSKTAAARGGFGGATASGYSTVTLEVTPREAEMLVFAEQIKGRLSLSLRNRNDTTYERELPKVDFKKIQSEIEELNVKRQTKMLAR